MGPHIGQEAAGAWEFGVRACFESDWKLLQNSHRPHLETFTYLVSFLFCSDSLGAEIPLCVVAFGGGLPVTHPVVSVMPEHHPHTHPACLTLLQEFVESQSPSQTRQTGTYKNRTGHSSCFTGSLGSTGTAGYRVPSAGPESQHSLTEEKSWA